MGRGGGIWRGPEDAKESQQWRGLGDALKGLPTVVPRYIRRLLRGGKAPGDSGRVDVPPPRVGCGARRDEPARELVGKAAAENEDGYATNG
jgi:hypothetical protein